MMPNTFQITVEEVKLKSVIITGIDDRNDDDMQE